MPRVLEKSKRRSPQIDRKHPASLRNGFACAMVLTVSFALSPGTGLSCRRRRADCSAQLDTGIGVSGPHDFAVRDSVVRPHETVRGAIASIAARLTFGNDWP
jgi:hypothetical protein